MKTVAGLIILLITCSLAFADDIKVIAVSPSGDVTISADTHQAKPEGWWPFLQAVRFDIFKTEEGIETFVGRIVITQTFPTYCTGILLPRLDGSGTTPAANEISKGMICRRTVKENLHSERKAYKIQKKAYKRQYKLTKIQAKTQTYKALNQITQDPNQIDMINTSVSHQTIEKKAENQTEIDKK